MTILLSFFMIFLFTNLASTSNSAASFASSPALIELQRVYEGIKDKAETKANFRRKFIKKVIPTEIKKSGTGFRPPNLYRYNLTD